MNAFIDRFVQFLPGIDRVGARRITGEFLKEYSSFRVVEQWIVPFPECDREDGAIGW